MGKLLFSFFLFTIILSANLFSQEYNVAGYVIDANNKKAVAGATVRVVGQNKGTYTSTRGRFNLPFLSGKQKVKVLSIGYKSKTVDVDKNPDTLYIKLEAIPVKLNEALVIGDIEPDEIIRRAIKRKSENISKIKTFKGMLYSKMVMELDGSIFGGTDGKGFTLTATIGDTAPDKYKMFVLESFSRVYKDYEKNVNHSEIVQRRQTSNLNPDNNLLSLTNFLNFYDNEIEIINTKFESPLSDNAFDFYDFKILKREIFDDKYIYVLNVLPTSEIFPLFKGTMKIVEDSYNLVELDLKPTTSSKITFVNDLHIIQKFDAVESGLWAPRFLEIGGKANVDIVKGMLDVNVDLTATSIYNEVEVNQPLPDSIYTDTIPRISVDKGADSLNLNFWEKNSLRRITDKEKKIYTQVDSLVKLDTAENKERSNFIYSIFTPYFDFNRVSSVSLGLSPGMSYKRIGLSTTVAYSFGLRDVIGKVNLEVDFDWLEMSLGYFSDIKSIGNDNSYHRLINSVWAGFFHFDYYDYYKSEGFKFSINDYNRYYSLENDFYYSRDYSLNKTTDRTIFTDKEMRKNPEADEGNYLIMENSLNIYLNRILPLRKIDMDLNLDVILGRSENDFKLFKGYQVDYEIVLPTFETGYEAMELSMKVKFGELWDVPMQYRHKIQSSLMFINLFGNFLTVDEPYYEEKRFLTFHFKYNLTDIWWRSIGFPTYEGRGLDLTLFGNTGRFSTASDDKTFESNQWYSEVGFGLERIPTFVSNVIYLGTGVGWGIGPLAKDKINWYINANFPFN